ncbi:UNVERIFIED_CONTAM: hypothetical protein K2H54_063857 [Gekko kuhli]
METSGYMRQNSLLFGKQRVKLLILIGAIQDQKLVPPKISNISSDITVNEGSNVTLVCMANGRPEPVITWRHLTPTGMNPWSVA